MIAVVLMVAAVAWLSRHPPNDELPLTDRYDHRFKKYNKRYFGVLFDWRWFKAQSLAESSLRRNALSDQGAVGIMQIHPNTFAEIVRSYTNLYNIADPKWNIAVGIAFNRYLFERWSEWVPSEQSLKFTLASYNAGLRRVAKATAQAEFSGRDPDRWRDVAPYTPRDTRRYVRRIYELMGYQIGSDE